MSESLPSMSSGNASATRALSMSTIAFTVCFAVWTIFSIIGVKIKAELGLTETQFGLLIGMPILTGSLVRIVLGVWTDRFGGRLVYTATMLAAAVATFLLAFATTYAQMLFAALGVGLAGGSFAVGVAYVSRFYSADRQGTALGIFGVGNVGAAVTKFVAPFVLLAWRLAGRRADLGVCSWRHGARLLVRDTRTIRSFASAASTAPSREASGRNSRR